MKILKLYLFTKKFYQIFWFLWSILSMSMVMFLLTVEIIINHLKGMFHSLNFTLNKLVKQQINFWKLVLIYNCTVSFVIIWHWSRRIFLNKDLVLIWNCYMFVALVCNKKWSFRIQQFIASTKVSRITNIWRSSSLN